MTHELTPECNEFCNATAGEIVIALGKKYGLLAFANGENVTFPLPEARELIGLLEDYHTASSDDR